MKRRSLLRSLGLLAGLTLAGGVAAPPASAQQPALYGLVTSVSATPGSRQRLAEILVRGAEGMPGCLSYLVALDRARPDVIWITEIWTSKTNHDQALNLPSVRLAMSDGKPLISGFLSRAETLPIAGVGSARSPSQDPEY